MSTPTDLGVLEMLFGLQGSITRYVFLPLRRGSRLPPSPFSTIYAPFKCCIVSSVMWTRLLIIIVLNTVEKSREATQLEVYPPSSPHLLYHLHQLRILIISEQILRFSHPGRPPDSMWLANVTSWDHTSYCHFCKPITPQSTFPLWTPTRMLISTPVASRSLLQGDKSMSKII